MFNVDLLKSDKKYKFVMGNRNAGYYHFMNERMKKLYDKCNDKHCFKCKQFIKPDEINNLIIAYDERNISMIHKTCLGGTHETTYQRIPIYL